MTAEDTAELLEAAMDEHEVDLAFEALCAHEHDDGRPDDYLLDLAFEWASRTRAELEEDERNVAA